jgi:hypothetical protein
MPGLKGSSIAYLCMAREDRQQYVGEETLRALQALDPQLKSRNSSKVFAEMSKGKAPASRRWTVIQRALAPR